MSSSGGELSETRSTSRPDLEVGRTELVESLAGPLEPADRTQQSASSFEAEDETLKFIDQNDHIVTVDAIPIVSVEIDGPLEPATQDEIITHSQHQEVESVDSSNDHETHAMATAVMLPFSIEPSSQEADVDSQEAAQRHHEAMANTIKNLKRRNRLLALIAVLMLIAVGIGIGILIGRDSNSDDSNPPQPDCDDELFMLNFCLNANPVNHLSSCRRCVENTAPFYNQPQVCLSPKFNGTSICQQIEACAQRDFCALQCFHRMVRYTQCRLSGSESWNDDFSDRLFDSEMADYGAIGACVLPCGQMQTLTFFPSVAPTPLT